MINLLETKNTSEEFCSSYNTSIGKVTFTIYKKDQYCVVLFNNFEFIDLNSNNSIENFYWCFNIFNLINEGSDNVAQDILKNITRFSCDKILRTRDKHIIL